MPERSQNRELRSAVLAVAGLIFAIWGARQAVVYFSGSSVQEKQREMASAHQSEGSGGYVWMMTEPAPENALRFWLPQYVDHQTLCEKEKISRALATMMLLDLENEINSHKGHYHVTRDNQYGGFRVDEFLNDNDGRGEYWVGTTHAVHYRCVR